MQLQIKYRLMFFHDFIFPHFCWKFVETSDADKQMSLIDEGVSLFLLTIYDGQKIHFSWNPFSCNLCEVKLYKSCTNEVLAWNTLCSTWEVYIILLIRGSRPEVLWIGHRASGSPIELHYIPYPVLYFSTSTTDCWNTIQILSRALNHQCTFTNLFYRRLVRVFEADHNK